MLEARVEPVLGFEDRTFKIPVKVSVVTTSDDSLREKLKKVKILYYDNHILHISPGDRIRAYGSTAQIVKEAKPQRIERLNEYGSVMEFYER